MATDTTITATGSASEMSITEAIERMQARVDGEFPAGDPENVGDMKLGIEVMTFIKLCRLSDDCTVPRLFHGETEE